jgi:acyl-CoA thioester hydrolase
MRFDLPADKKLVHAVTVPIRWGDMDAMAHVNNTIYFRYCEIARLDWMFKVGAGVDPAGQGPIVINAFCNFLRQLEFPGEVRVTVYVAKPGRSSFESYHTMERTDEPGVVCAEGGARIVWTDYPAKKSAPMPAWFRALLG